MSEDKTLAQLTAEAARASWQYKAIAHTRGNSTPTGCIVLAILNKVAKHPPWLNGTATITREGLILADFVARDYTLTRSFLVGPVQSIVADFNRLADEIKLVDAERLEMFAALRQWIAVDERATSGSLN